MYLEDYGAAARAYQAAGRIAPDRVYLHLMLGEAYVKMQQYDRAKAVFEQVLEMDPEHEVALRKQRALEAMDLSP
jgi:cytochrome c-type biogenesis protein CcmH/NrfG